MRDILLILLGSLLALAGSIVVHYIQRTQDRKTEDERLLYHATEILDRYVPFSPKAESAADDLRRIAHMIKTRVYRPLTLGIYHFGDRGMDIYKTPQERLFKIDRKRAELKEEIFTAINKELRAERLKPQKFLSRLRRLEKKRKKTKGKGPGN